MALRRMDGADYYTLGNNSQVGLANQWSSGYIADKDALPGFDGGAHLYVPRAGGTENMYTNLPVSGANVTHGGWHYVSHLGDNVLTFSHSGGSNQFTLTTLSDGTLQLRRGGTGGTVVASSAAGVIPLSTFFFMELRVFCDPAAGTADIIVGATSVISATGLNTQGYGSSPLVGRLELCEPVSGNVRLDSWYWRDDLTSMAAGAPYIETRWPIADVPGGDWAASTGSILTDMLSQKRASTDRYITAGDVAATQMFDLDSFVPRTISSVKGLRIIVNAKKADAVARTLSIVLDIGGTIVTGAAKALSTSGSFYWDIYELNPVTGLAWTDAEVQALNVGVTAVAGTAVAASYVVNSIHVEILRSRDIEAQAGGHRYWRVRIRGVQSASRGGTNSFEFFDYLGARVLGEPYANGNYGSLIPANANDSLNGTVFVTSVDAASGTGYIYIDPGPNVAFLASKMRLGPQAASYGESIVSFTIGYSDDGSVWTDTDAWTGEANWSGDAYQRRTYNLSLPAGPARRRNSVILP